MVDPHDLHKARELSTLVLFLGFYHLHYEKWGELGRLGTRLPAHKARELDGFS